MTQQYGYVHAIADDNAAFTLFPEGTEVLAVR